MKPIRPMFRYDAEAGYPSVADCALSRRSFLAGAAAALGTALLPDPEAIARSRSRWLRTDIPVNHRLKGCSWRRYVEKLIVQTRSKRLHRFLRQDAQRKAARQAVMAVLQQHSCADTEDRKKLERLERELGRALVRVYRTRTRRTVARPLVTLVMGRRRSLPNPGFSATRPPRPVPHP